jgi:thymidylate synthase (FAD)
MEIGVLDKGYVRAIDVLGSDLSVVNAARVSYDKESKSFSDNDKRLLEFLWKNNHTSPFRHASISMEIYAPLFVARQWWKHVVAGCHIDDQNGWNESSRRYVTEKPEFYIPNPWLSAPENKKQGAAGPIDDEILSGTLNYALGTIVRTGVANYEYAMGQGVAPEQARLFLPAYGMYIRWRWATSLHGLMHFIELRTHAGAQYEIQQYAHAVKTIAEGLFPETLALIDHE